MEDIELVIKLPKEEYERLPYIDIFKLRKYIENGTPLPKGHGDLIDRSELLKEPMDTANYPSNYVRIAKAIIEADKEQEDEDA